jgi:Na+/H+ antiporter NhaA
MNGLRTALIALALVLDALCIILIAFTFFTQHLDNEGLLGISLFLMVIVANVPPLVWCLFPPRPRAGDPAAASIFE